MGWQAKREVLRLPGAATSVFFLLPRRSARAECNDGGSHGAARLWNPSTGRGSEFGLLRSLRWLVSVTVVRRRDERAAV